MGDLFNEIRNAYLIGVIVGIVLVVIGVAGVIHYFASSNVKDILLGAGMIFFGSLFLSKGVMAFIPAKQQRKTRTSENICPYCGAVTEANAAFCEKCRRKLDDASA